MSFDVLSYFSNVPMEETLEIIKNVYKSPGNVMGQTGHCVKNTYFTYNEQNYKQTVEVPMHFFCSLLSPILAHLFKKNREV